jgi:hypothetical protein
MAEQIEPTYAQIRQRAYEIFEERGCEHGRDVADWLAAEQQLRVQAFERVLRAAFDHKIVAPARMPVHFAGAASIAA